MENNVPLLFLALLLGLWPSNASTQPTTDVLNNQINWELRTANYYSSADGDGGLNGQDDLVMKTKTWTSQANAWSDWFCHTWACDAPCSDPYTGNWRWAQADLFEATFNFQLSAYESDNSPECTLYNSDQFQFQGTSGDKYVIVGLPCTWYNTYGPGGGGGGIFPDAGGVWDLSINGIWRYYAGDSWDQPLQFGTIGFGQIKQDQGANAPQPPGTENGTPLGWTNSEGEASPDVFYSFSLDAPASVRISTDFDFTNFDTYLALYDAAHTQIAYDDDGGSTGEGNKSVISAALGAGAYHFRVEGYGTAVGQYRVEVSSLLANDAACSAILLPADGTVQSGFSNIGATAATGESAITPPNGPGCADGWCETTNTIQNSVWFKFVAPSSGAVEVSTCGLSGFDSQIAVYAVSDCNDFSSYLLLKASDDSPGCSGFTSRITVGPLLIDATYYVLVDGYNGASGDIGLQISPITLTAVHDTQTGRPGLEVAPNPTGGRLSLRLTDALSFDTYILSDLAGKTIREARFDHAMEEVEIDLALLAPGMYLMQVQSGAQVFSRKITRQ